MPRAADCVQAIVNMGFTSLEAEIYTFLTRESGVTGYRVAQAIGKAAANTYKALESLERKGAILVEEGDNRAFRAVPPDEFLAGLERQFADRREQAAAALSRLAPPPADDRLYELRSRSQVFERCRAMLKRCRDVAVMDLFPAVVVALWPELEAAAKRGVDVIIKTYEPLRVSGARVVVRPRGYEIVDAIPAHLLSLNIDGAEHLLAMLPGDGDEVHQAIWTSSAIVSFLLYNGLINEVSQVAVMQELDKGDDIAAVRRCFTELRSFHPISSRGPAYQNLLKQMGIASA